MSSITHLNGNKELLFCQLLGNMIKSWSFYVTGCSIYKWIKGDELWKEQMELIFWMTMLSDIS